MKLFSLAMLPAIVLMVYIYKKDKREKEPFSKLFICFFWGMVSVIPAIVLELLFTGMLGEAVSNKFWYVLLDNFVVVAFTEELCKYFFLNRISRKNTYYDYFFDGIVYSVFVSLGFAAAENVMYVTGNGLSVAILRMFTAVPGHMCFAVFMGYYYSLKLCSEYRGELKDAKKYAKMAIIYPMLIHGAYDFFASWGGILSTIVWIVGVVFLLIKSFRFVSRASNDDIAFYELIGGPETTGEGTKAVPETAPVTEPVKNPEQ